MNLRQASDFLRNFARLQALLSADIDVSRRVPVQSGLAWCVGSVQEGEMMYRMDGLFDCLLLLY